MGVFVECPKCQLNYIPEEGSCPHCFPSAIQPRSRVSILLNRDLDRELASYLNLSDLSSFIRVNHYYNRFRYEVGVRLFEDMLGGRRSDLPGFCEVESFKRQRLFDMSRVTCPNCRAPVTRNERQRRDTPDGYYTYVTEVFCSCGYRTETEEALPAGWMSDEDYDGFPPL